MPFYVPENPRYTILDSAADSVRFTVERCLVPYRGHLAAHSSFVNPEGEAMHWHPFGDLEGPGWAANAVGGAAEIFHLGRVLGRLDWQQTALRLLAHVLHDGFIEEDGFLWSYRDTRTDERVLNYLHRRDWLCPGAMAKVAFQMLDWSPHLPKPLGMKLRTIARATAHWLHRRVPLLENGWYPRRITPQGEPYPERAEGGPDPIFADSGDGLFIVQLLTRLTAWGLEDYRRAVAGRVEAFIAAGGFFGSINHDTYDHHENVAYAVAFRTLREAAKVLSRAEWRAFAYEVCLRGLDRFKMEEDRNGVATTGLLWMEESWDTAYLWENAEAALAYFEAAAETGQVQYELDGLTILRAIAKHHHGPYGFLTEGVDWNNHVGRQHHIGGVEFGDIQYTEPLLNNQHIVEPTVFYLEHLAQRRWEGGAWVFYDCEGNRLGRGQEG